MQNFICVQCGTQFDETTGPPSRCPICQDERQFVRHTGQEWTTLKRLTANHHNRIEDETPQLLGIGTEPEFAIGQRALLLQSPGGNLLWDCISLLDDETIAEVNARGGIRAIAISHPHFYSSMIEWAEFFDAQIFLHSADREWVMRKSLRIQFWEGSTLSLWDGLTLINCGVILKAAPCCIGQQVLMAKAPCSRATSLPSCRIGVTSVFCGVIPISFRSESRRSAASSKESSLPHSSRFMAAGGKRTFSQTQKQPLRDPPNAICAGSVARLSFL